jgi:hypothetical protein
MWPKLNFPPINLWNVPYMFKERTIIDKILDEELRFYIKMGRYASVLYLGKKQAFDLFLELPDNETVKRFNYLDIIRVEQEDYLRVG